MVKYPIKFKAAILEQTGRPLVVDDVIFDGPLEVGQVLVRIHYSGICGKQLEEISGTSGPDRFLPHMLGHEGSGVVVDIGPEVTKVKKGDHVVIHWLKGSGLDAPTPIYKRNDKRVNAGWITTFNEFGVVCENRVTKISDETNLLTACLLGCAVTTGVGSILNDAKVQPGESVAIFGCGGVGLCAVQGAAYAQANPIIAVDISPNSLEMAVKFGATHTIDPISNDVLAEIKAITDDQGAKTVIVAVAKPQIIEQAIQASSLPGSVFFVAVPPVGAKVMIDPLDIHRMRKLSGSFGGGSLPDRDIPAYLELDKKGHLKLRDLISNVVSLNEINDAISFVRTGKGGRCIIAMSDE